MDTPEQEAADSRCTNTDERLLPVPTFENDNDSG